MSSSNLAFSLFDSQINTLDLELKQLQEAIAKKKLLKRTAIKVISKFESALYEIFDTFEQLGESARTISAFGETPNDVYSTELKADSFADSLREYTLFLIGEYFSKEEKKQEFNSKLPLIAQNLEQSDCDLKSLEGAKELIFLDGLVYDPNNQTAYCEARSKARADLYGYCLTKQYAIADNYQVVLTEKQELKLLDTKYQLEIKGISEVDALHLAKFNFLKEIDAETHKELLAHWSDRKIVLPPACQPTPKPTPLSEISVGDLVHKGKPEDLYEVKEVTEINGQLMAQVKCLRHKDFPDLEDQDFTFRDVYLVEKNTPETLVEFVPQRNDSNEFFSWQTTSNSALASYFNVSKGIRGATYIGANNKQNLKSVGANLQNLFKISFEIRKATRLTEFDYELKITGLDDEGIGWLTQFDFSQTFYPQFACIIQKLEIPSELKLTEHNWLAIPGATIVNNLFPCNCHLVKVDSFGTGIAKDQFGNQFEIHLDDWHLAEDFFREADFTYQAIKACNSKKELEIVKNSNQLAEDFLKFVWMALPVEEKARIKQLCEQ